jgi:type IV pilus assembly protein PilP
MKGLGAVIILSIILTCGGCGGETPKATKVSMPPVGKAAAPPAKKAPPLAGEVKLEPPSLVSYTYNPAGKPNPFKPLVVERPQSPVKKVAEVVAEPGTPLEKLELTQLKLVAMIWNIADPKAMVEDKAGRGFIVAKGTPIGKNKGRVTQITYEGIVVNETYETSSGKFNTRDIPIKLYAD